MVGIVYLDRGKLRWVCSDTVGRQFNLPVYKIKHFIDCEKNLDLSEKMLTFVCLMTGIQISIITAQTF